MQEQIKVLLSQGLSIRKVALALGVSRQTVRKFGSEPAVDAGAAEAPTSPPPCVRIVVTPSDQGISDRGLA